MLKTFKLLLYPLHSDTVIRDFLVPRYSLLIGARYAWSYGLIAIKGKSCFVSKPLSAALPADAVMCRNVFVAASVTRSSIKVYFP